MYNPSENRTHKLTAQMEIPSFMIYDDTRLTMPTKNLDVAHWDVNDDHLRSWAKTHERIERLNLEVQNPQLVHLCQFTHSPAHAFMPQGCSEVTDFGVQALLKRTTCLRMASFKGCPKVTDEVSVTTLAHSPLPLQPKHTLTWVLSTPCVYRRFVP